MYVRSVCTALHFPNPSADSALTMTSYSVPAASLGRTVELSVEEPEMMIWWPQEVALFILYWMLYLEMGSSICGVVQVACKADFLDDTALDRDRPVIWEGIPKMYQRHNVKFNYHRDAASYVLIVVHVQKQMIRA